MRKYVGEMGLLFVAVVWGIGFVAAAISLETMTAYQTMAIRFFIAACVLSVIFVKHIRALNRSTVLAGIVLGTIVFFGFALQTVGLQYTTPSKNAFLTAVNVVIVPFIGYILYRRGIDRFGLLGAVLAILGVGVLSLEAELSLNFGDGLTLLCAICFAFHIFFTSEFVKKHSPIGLTIVQMITAFILSFVVVLSRGEAMNLNFESKGLLAAVYLGVVSTTIAFLVQTIAQKHTTETKAAIILSTEAVFGTLFSVMILHEMLTVRMVIGCILILIGILIAETKLQFLHKKAGQAYSSHK
ncbi:DMT family transporter [Paenibacillus sp. N1-5-1-14]|uniref:DMT family transporter n=1 Tax=Paenibacillus radicibacter TaxID=2972488 RepID=UPI00215983F4|nr:DMT family transporter [Paenibacillus radicibacter]MCR8643404.1 DMT family transporter [Paenibacillus radicibacter]